MTRARSPSKVKVARQKPEEGDRGGTRDTYHTSIHPCNRTRVGLNEIVYRLKELRDPLMVEILEQVLRSYDDLIVERLRHTEIYPSKARRLGRHVRKDDPKGRSI